VDTEGRVCQGKIKVIAVLKTPPDKRLVASRRIKISLVKIKKKRVRIMTPARVLAEKKRVFLLDKMDAVL
jgi:hypothetical protein